MQHWATAQSGSDGAFCQALAGAVIADTLTQLRQRVGAGPGTTA